MYKKKLSKSIIGMILLLPALHAGAQSSANSIKTSLARFVDSLNAIYYAINAGDLPNEHRFRSLFAGTAIPVYNDYYDHGTIVFQTPDAYIRDISKFFIDNPEVPEGVSVKLASGKQLCYAENANGNYFIWLYRSFDYRFNGQPKSLSGWTRLEVKKNKTASVFKIISVSKAYGAPPDNDGDGIADEFDACPGTAAGEEVTIDGCALTKVSPPPPPPPVHTAATTVVEPVHVRIIHEPKPRRKPSPPAVRFSLEVTGGSLLAIGTSFARTQLLDYTSHTWKDSGSLGNYGFFGGLSLQYNVNKWLGIDLGYAYAWMPLNSKLLRLQVKNYLGSKNIAYKNVGIVSDAYRFHIAYIGLALGNFKNETTTFKVEPLIGEVNTSLLLPNKLNLQVDYADGTTQFNALSFNYPAFPVYGGKITFQKSWGDEGKAKLQFCAWYLAGKSGAEAQQVTFRNLPDHIIFPAPDLQLIGASVGLYITLSEP